MTRDDEYLIQLLSYAINKEPPIPPDYEPVNWEYIYKQSIHHNISPLIYTIVRELPAAFHPSFMKPWQFQTIQIYAKSMQNHNDLLNLFDEFSKAGIEVLLYKGLAIGSLYPDLYLRTMGDVDLLVRQENLENAVELLLRNGYKKTEENEEKKFSYFISPNGLVIDLQTKIWNYYSNRDRELSELIESTVWQNPCFLSIDGKEIPTLGIQEHLFCIICHAAKHLISQGIGIRHLADIALYVDRYCDLIDWTVLLDKLEKLKLDVFLSGILQISVHYLRMNERLTERLPPVKNDIIELFIEELIDAGLFGGRTRKRLDAAPAVREVYYFNSNSKKFKLLILTIFPPVTALVSKYSYAKRHHFLLPIAWVHRGLRHLFKRDGHGSLNVADRANSSSERVQLLGKLGIL